MNIKEIWPEPPIPKRPQEPPRIPKVIEAFQRTVPARAPVEDVRKLSEVLSDISEVFSSSVSTSMSIKQPRDIEVEVKKIGVLYEEVNTIIKSLREEEAKERIIDLIKKQIKKKQNLIHSLNLKEKENPERENR